jgi:hypothetical protein
MLASSPTGRPVRGSSCQEPLDAGSHTRRPGNDLEEKVAILEKLPARMDALELQIVQLRSDMNAGYSSLRTELRAEIAASADFVMTTLRAEIRAGDEETRRFMRVLERLDRQSSS